MHALIVNATVKPCVIASAAAGVCGKRAVRDGVVHCRSGRDRVEERDTERPADLLHRVDQSGRDTSVMLRQRRSVRSSFIETNT